MGLSLLAQSSISLNHWDDAFPIASYLINRLPTLVLKNKSPFELLLHKSSNYNFLKVFGCLCYPYFQLYNDRKLIVHSRPYTFLDHGIIKC